MYALFDFAESELNMKIIQVELAVLVIVVLAGPHRLRAGTEANAAAVAGVTSSFTDAWNRSDWQEMAKVFIDDGTLVIPDGTMFEGRNAISAFYRDVFSRGYRGSRATSAAKRVSVVREGVAIVDGEWNIEGAHAAKGDLRKPEHGIFCAVLVRHAGAWMIAALREQTSATHVERLPATSLK